MGTITFQLPSGLDAATAGELAKACLAGGPDSMPWPTDTRLEPGRLILRRNVEDSGFLVVPWNIPAIGRVTGTTTTLMERAEPYQFQVELARGKVNQLRCQAADWEAGGLMVPPALSDQIRRVSRAFGRAVTQPPSPEAGTLAEAALAEAYQAAEQLVLLYIEQMFQNRHLRQPRLDGTLACAVGPELLAAESAEALARACNGLSVPLSWKLVEPTEGTYRWQPWDAHINWAHAQGLSVMAGPLIDFSAARLPDWLWLWERDLSSLANFMCEYVQATVKRYRGRVASWQVTGSANSASILGLGEDELLWLTLRLAEVARQTDPQAELVVGVAQPWGEYMAREDRTHSPLVFVDTLLRSGLNLAAIDLELIFGITPRGSYCRDLLETSRLIDMYSLMGVPLRVTLGYPSEEGADAAAEAELAVGAGKWHGSPSPANQAEWAATYASLCLCKPWVRGVRWIHLDDSQPHVFPFCGLIDAAGQPKPALHALRRLREAHLR